MKEVSNCINKKNTKSNPVWFMRQAGRYLPEFREIRKINSDFIKLCLNPELTEEITIQPIRRFDLDAAIIFSDILMVPYALGQKVVFKKGYGPLLDDFQIENLSKIEEEKFINELQPVYKAIEKVRDNKIIRDKDLIGFVGAPWTVLVYMLNKQSPKKKINQELLKNKNLVSKLFEILDKFLKLHIKKQVENGATVIQIFDSWSGLVDDKNLDEFIYKPTLSLVNFVKSLKVPVICFPRNIKNYKNFVSSVKPDAINIDYNVDLNKISTELDIPIQGGLDPKILLSDKENLKKKAKHYLDIFKDHPYIFNLGHGVLPETKPEMVDYLVKFIKSYK